MPPVPPFIRVFAQVTSLSCIYDLSFYSRLVVATVGPVIATAMICVVGFVFHKNVRVEKKSTVVYICSSALLCGSYMCLTRTAVTIFQTFNCQAYGDDPTLYLVVDQSLECGTADHVWYQVRRANAGRRGDFGSPLHLCFNLWLSRPLPPLFAPT